MLANSIALITLAVMLGSEASRARPPWNYGLWTLTTLVVLVAIGLQPIAGRLPQVGEFLTSIFSAPAAWFVLVIGLFLVLRPFWADKKVQTRSVSTLELSNRAFNIVQRVRHQRDASWSQRHFGIEPIGDVIRDGWSYLLLFEAEGFSVPNLVFQNQPERTALAMEVYFSALHPLLRDGHIAVAKQNSPQIGENAITAGRELKNTDWSGND